MGVAAPTQDNQTITATIARTRVADFVMRLSGGAANSNPASSIGGAVSSVAAPSGLWANAPSGDAAAGSVNYRCVYVYNPTAGPVTNVLLIDTNTPSTQSTVAGRRRSGNGVDRNGNGQPNDGAGRRHLFRYRPRIGIVDRHHRRGAGQGEWLRRTVTAGAAPYTADNVIVEADTAGTLPRPRCLAPGATVRGMPSRINRRYSN